LCKSRLGTGKQAHVWLVKAYACAPNGERNKQLG